MLIHILQKGLTIDRCYNVFINNKKRYFVRGDSSYYTLYSTNNIQLLSIFKKWFTFLPAFNIYFNSRTISERREALRFKTKSFFDNVYYCNWDNDLYEIYVHKELKYSIFKNGVQVAGINQERWGSFKEDGFRMECDADSHKEFMISLTIILDHLYNRKVSILYGLFQYNIGVMNESIPYDENWQPKL